MHEQDHLDYSFFPFRTLIKLRWMALLGQISAILFLYHIKIQMPYEAVFGVIGVSFWINLIFHAAYTRELTLSEKTLPYFLLYDLVQLGVLLYLTGGLFNPFVVFILGPLLISSSFQDTKLLSLTLIAGSMTVAILYTSPYPLPWFDGGIILPPFLRLVIAMALWISILFYGSYVFYVHHMKQSLLDKLQHAKSELFRQKQFSELGLLAAASAHELGTPLSTIMLTAKEMEEQLKQEDTPHKTLKEDAQLIREQTARCQDILKKLSADYKNSGEFSIPIKSFLLSIVHKYPTPKDIIFEGEFKGDIRASFELSLAVGNLIQNALRFARHKVTLSYTPTQTGSTLRILDDGPGFPPQMLDTLGEILLTNSTPEHLGIGLYIAKSLFRNGGIEVAFSNKEGACCDVHIPQELITFQEAA